MAFIINNQLESLVGVDASDIVVDDLSHYPFVYFVGVIVLIFVEHMVDVLIVRAGIVRRIDVMRRIGADIIWLSIAVIYLLRVGVVRVGVVMVCRALVRV